MELSLFDLSFLIAGHLGFSVKGLRKVGWIQFLLHKTFAYVEPSILRMSDYILYKPFFSHTNIGRWISLSIAQLSLLLPHSIVITTGAAERLIDFVSENEGPNGIRLVAGPCLCQKALDRWEEPSCKDLQFLYTSEIFYNMKIGFRIISSDEAKEILRDCHKAGLVPQVYFCMQSSKWTFCICNCEEKICVPTRVYLLTGKMLYPGPEIVSYDPALCVGFEKCGRCIERCIFDANILEGSNVNIDYQKCLGCGLCVSTCIGKARTMVRREDYRHQHQVPADILLGDQKNTVPQSVIRSQNAT
jgi:ferredoxin